MTEHQEEAQRRGPRIARQFGEPRGLLGLLVGRGMARGNAGLNRWVAATLVDHISGPARRVIELGSGPGVGLVALHHAFPDAQLWGLDRSPLMVRRAGRQISRLDGERVSVQLGDATDLMQFAPVDLIVAVHVLYFWSDPVSQLGMIRDALREGGALALAYQTQQRMPAFAQRNFPTAGHQLYDDDEKVRSLATAGGFSSTELLVKREPGGEEGRMLLARR